MVPSDHTEVAVGREMHVASAKGADEGDNCDAVMVAV